MVISKFVNKTQNLNTDNIILIHHSMDINKFKKDSKLENRYFPYLKDYLKNKKKNIHHIVWFYNFWTDRLKFLKKYK